MTTNNNITKFYNSNNIARISVR